jgi:hypothetical protein
MAAQNPRPRVHGVSAVDYRAEPFERVIVFTSRSQDNDFITENR